jgi:MFS family permease
MTERLGTAARDTFRSLHVRNFRLFFTGQLVSQTGTWLTSVALTLLVLDMTGSGVAIGVLTACLFGPVLLLGAWAGSVADRSDKRLLLIRTQTGAMVQSLALAAVVLTGHASLPVLYSLALVTGVLTAFDNPARRAFVVEMVPGEMVPNAVSLNSAVMTGSRVLGPAAAGLLVVTVGYGWAFLLDGLSYIAVLWGLRLMSVSELHPSTPTPRGAGQVREGLRYVRSKPDLLVPLLMMAAIGTLAFNFSVTLPLLVTGPLDGGEGTFTLLFSVLSLGSLVGALWTARRSDVAPTQIVVAATGFGLTMLLLAASPTLWAAFPAAVLLGIASITFMVTSTAIVQLRAAPEYRGRVLALQAMVFLGSTPIGGPIVGWISDTAGPRVGIVVGGVACLAAAAWGHRVLARSSDPEAGPRDVTGPQPVVVTADQPAVTLAD